MILASVLALAASIQAPSILTREQNQALKDSLFIEGLNVSDLRVDNPPKTGSPYLLKVHQNPIETLLTFPSQTGDAFKNPLRFLRRQFTDRFDPGESRRPAVDIKLPDEIPASLQSPLIRLIRAVLAAQ